ncbi:phospholipase A [Flavisphingomonas formosensis]|uniref:phospholipase A n=1 Tax=Flavisphingomonas formosensis TaxID=861534 RepID=UPI001E3B404C|nr:phospholipase A [Sphingomonas formosensis]
MVRDIRPDRDPSTLIVTIVILNPDRRAREGAPDRLSGELIVSGRRMAVTMDRLSPVAREPIAPGGFVETSYRLSLPADGVGGEAATLALPGLTGLGYAFSLPDAPILAEERRQPERSRAPALPATDGNEATRRAAKPNPGNAYLGNISAYAPIYAVYGPGTDSEAKIQISFKYQLFGRAGEVGRGAPFLNGIHFGYTQRMFWDLGAESSPFRNIDYMPELFYLVPPIPLGDRVALGGQIGFRHESNGRDGVASRSANTLYVQPVATIPLGGYTLSLGPHLSFYVGDLSDNPDIRRYRGATSLFAEIGRDDGLRLTTNVRFNASSGKGAIDGELSYPLDRIIDTSLNLYLFGQAFAGYGENLLDYDRRTTRLRFGIGIVR